MELYLKILSFLCGFVCKLYDDLKDNERLLIFKNDFSMELLKGLHYIFFTLISSVEPTFFIIEYVANFINSLGNSDAWKNPYEKSLLFSFVTLFLVIDYNKITYLNKYDYFLILLFFVFMFLEPKYITEEYSFSKLIIRSIFVLLSLFASLLFILLSDVTICICLYGAGYFLSSIFAQYYSLFIYNKNTDEINKSDNEIDNNIKEVNKNDEINKSDNEIDNNIKEVNKNDEINKLENKTEKKLL